MTETAENIVSKTIYDLNQLMDESDEIREQLVAQGVQMQTINVLVEMGFHDGPTNNDALIKSAMDSAEHAHGTAAINKQDLVSELEKLVLIEKDIAGRRRAAKQSGLDLQALNFLARIIRQNPGDGGERAINNFLGYSRACNIELSGIDQITQKFTQEPESVLPRITRPVETNRQFKLMCRDVAIGSLFAIVLMTLMV